jgi:hypothetical protein
MFIQEIVCPHCGEITKVNVHASASEDSGGSYSDGASCHHCRGEIGYSVQYEGRKAEIDSIWAENDELEESSPQQEQKAKNQYDVFLSYSDRDREEAEALFAAITQAGGRAFMAPKILSPGDEFAEEIRASLEGAREVWLLMSPNSIGSEWVISEWGAAWVLKKRIVPILHRCAPDSLPERLRRLQCIDMHRYMQLVEQTFRKAR